MEMDAERCRRRLRAHIEAAWPIVEPTTAFVPQLHARVTGQAPPETVEVATMTALAVDPEAR
jgi:hypothetical protein